MLLTNARDNRLLNTIEMRERRRIMKSMPYSMQLEVTTKCNFACIMCARDKYHGKGDDLTTDILDIVMDQLFPSCQDVIVSSFGEPLLFPRIKEIFGKIDHENGLELGFFTNFVLMTEDMAETIIKSGVGYVNASIDGASKESYEKIRKGGKWDILLDKLAMFQAVKKRLNSETPRMNLCIVGSTLNVEEIPAFVDMAHRFGFDSVKYNHNMYVDDEHMDYLALVHKKELTVRMFRKGFKRAMELGIHTNFDKIPFSTEGMDLEDDDSPSVASDASAADVLRNKIRLRYNRHFGWRIKNTWDHSGRSPKNFTKLFAVKGVDLIKHKIPVLRTGMQKAPVPHPIPNDAPPVTCGNPWTHVHVKSDGLVYPCCFSDEVMGDLRTQKFEEIWNGEKYQDLRESLRTGNYWGSCLRSSCNWVEGQNSNQYGCVIEILNPVTAMHGGEGTTLKVRVTNTGQFRWDTPKDNPLSPVSLSYRLFGTKLELLDEGLHVPITKPMLPGATIELELPVKPIAYAGDLTLKVDMVHERVTWFGERGSNANAVKLHVTNVPFAAYLSPANSVEIKEKLYEKNLIAGDTIEIPVSIRNVGSEPLGDPSRGDAICYHFQRMGDELHAYSDSPRIPFPKILQPGEEIDVRLKIEIPQLFQTTRYFLEIDIWREGDGYLRSVWKRPLLQFPVRVARKADEVGLIPEKRSNGKPYLWELRGQCVSNTGNKGIW